MPDNAPKWTEGPWQACREAKCSCRQVWCPDAPVFTAKPAACVNVGTAHQQWGDEPEMLYGEIPEEQTEANANLIAAAPELYAALEALVSKCERQAWRIELPVLVAARASLAKARGESE